MGSTDLFGPAQRIRPIETLVDQSAVGQIVVQTSKDLFDFVRSEISGELELADSVSDFQPVQGRAERLEARGGLVRSTRGLKTAAILKSQTRDRDFQTPELDCQARNPDR